MTPEERLLGHILDEMKELREQFAEFQRDVRKELASMRNEMHRQDKDLYGLKGKVALVAAGASAAVVGVSQWVMSRFFS